MIEQAVRRTPWWRRWWMIVIWAVLALALIIGIFGSLSGNSGEEVPRIPLFADASNGIQQWVGGNTMPVGTYDFECSRGGNVSIQLAQPPYTVNLAQGDQTRDVGPGDLVSAGFCKVYGPK